jgi:hypothetical protein
MFSRRFEMHLVAAWSELVRSAAGRALTGKIPMARQGQGKAVQVQTG